MHQKVHEQTQRDGQNADESHTEVKDIVSLNNDQNPLFNKLNFDVRQIIYDYLYGGLPPLSLDDAQSDCRGLVLSCKQAYAELAKPAKHHFTIFAQEFGEKIKTKFPHRWCVTTHIPTPIPDGFSALGNITLHLPFSAFNLYNTCFIHSYRPGVLLQVGRTTWDDFWAPRLLHRHFDRVTFLAQDSDKSVHETPHARNRVINGMREYTEVLASLISRDWITHEGNPNAKSTTDSDTILHGIVGGKLLKPSFVKHIAFAWNLTTSSDPSFLDNVNMVGTKFTYSPDYYSSLHYPEKMRSLPYDKVWPHRYEVMSADELVGEMGIVSPLRWMNEMKEAENEYGDSLFWKNLVEEENVQMLGIGGKLRQAPEETTVADQEHEIAEKE